MFEVDSSVLDSVLERAVRMGASDCHAQVGSKWTVRVDGQLLQLSDLPELTARDTIQFAKAVVLASGRATEENVGVVVYSIREADYSYQTEHARFRCQIALERGNLTLSFRVIRQEIPSFDELLLPDVIREIASEERGLVLVTGAAGNGKTTTLASIVDYINSTRKLRIVTLEDPIEYLHKNRSSSVIQREIGMDSESFASGLRAALRQDPNVLLVGEMRDRETVELVLKAAETGHLVLSSFHTTDVLATILRFLAFYSTWEQPMARLRLAECLRAIISQRLLPRADGRGRVVATEVLRGCRQVEEAIREGYEARLREIMESEKGRHLKMHTFSDSLQALFEKGLVSLECYQSTLQS